MAFSERVSIWEQEASRLVPSEPGTLRPVSPRTVNSAQIITQCWDRRSALKERVDPNDVFSDTGLQIYGVKLVNICLTPQEPE